MEIKVNSEGSRATVRIPGLHHSDFDRTGKLNVRTIQSLLTVARMIAYHTPNTDTGCTFLDYDKMTTDRFTFMASTKTTYDESIYKLSRQNALAKPPTLAIDVHLGYIGNSSLNSVADLYCLESGQVYASNINQVVTVDKATRKPTTIPSWWKEKYEKQAENGAALKIPLFQVPANTHIYETKVPWTDIDNYKHTNYICYIRYCQDAAMDASFAGYFSAVKDDFLKYSVKCMEVSYKGESVANDLLRVHVWENPNNPFELHFSIEKKGAVIFQNTITLYEKSIE